jgi:tetratricopeptide (TPR) repeat protein
MFQLGCESGGARKARAWRRSAAMDPLAMGPRHLLASRLILDEGRLAEGLAFADTVAMGVDDAESHYLRGRALLALGRHEESAAAFVQALARGGEARSWGGLAMARHRQARHADAVGAWRRALALDMNYFNRMTRRSDDIAGEARAWRASQESAPEAPPHVDVAPRPPAPVLAGARPGRCGA